MKTIYRATIQSLLIGGIIFTSCTGTENGNEIVHQTPITVEVSAPKRLSNSTISASGQIIAAETAFISTRLMGSITRIKVDVGDRVEKGQLLVTINNEDIQAKRAQAEAMIAEVEFALQDAQKDFDRYKELYDQQSASAKEFENAELRYRTVNSKREAAQQLKNEADAMLVYSNLVAPFTGIVTQKHADEGNMASPGMPILTIEQHDHFKVMASVFENEIGGIEINTKVIISVKSTGKTFESKVSEISPSSQFTGGQFQIRMDVPAFERASLFPGMFVTVDFASTKAADQANLLVPTAAIIHQDQLTGLFTISDDQTAQLRWLKLGKALGNQVEVLSGLHDNEQFIISSEGRLFNGVPVSVK